MNKPNSDSAIDCINWYRDKSHKLEGLLSSFRQYHSSTFLEVLINPGIVKTLYRSGTDGLNFIWILY